MKPLHWIAFALLAAAVSAGPSVARAGSGYTLVVVPARYSVLQVAFDVARQNSVLLVSYQGEPTAAEPLLHAWNGSEWVYVSMKDFREVNFVEKAPERTILVGNQDVLPASLREAASWSPKVEEVPGLATAELVNDFGRLFKWKRPQWQWFAARYNLSLRDESEEARTRSWYDQTGPIVRPPIGDILGGKVPPETPPGSIPPAAPVKGLKGEDVTPVKPAADEPPAPVTTTPAAPTPPPAAAVPAGPAPAKPPPISSRPAVP